MKSLLNRFKPNYKRMPKPRQKDNSLVVNKTGRWINSEDRILWPYSWKKRGRNFCIDCNHSQDNMEGKCIRCGGENVITLSPDVRVPRKKASKRTWKNFRKNFILK